ncbi:helix-turn-helix transcriptional regulator [Mucilaginibacter sp. R-33]|uniref:helix-turn-helix transcriptional regulator n=1 Tax=Mucilaginibacter sp. R-33 TaxID=3416711 RepID=UPI003CED00E4
MRKNSNDPESLSYLASCLKSARAEKQISQAKLSEASGVSIRTIRRIEGAKGDTTLLTILRLARGLDITLSVLFKGSFLEAFFQGVEAENSEKQNAKIQGENITT